MLRNILYLDEPKMYSLSSQIFEGLTEYMLNENSSSSEKHDEQKGPVASGRKLADAMKHHETAIEKRVLHDYAFELFENKVVDGIGILDVKSAQAEDIDSKLSSHNFIRIHARATFIDAEKLNSLLQIFNKLGEALAYVTKYQDMSAATNALEAMKVGMTDKKKLAEIAQKQKAINDVAKVAKDAGLYQDPIFLNHLSTVTKFGFSDQLEIQQAVGSQYFSACLKREHLRESVDLVMRKYSRITEKEFVVLGLITQTTEPVKHDPQETTGKMSMKEALTNMILHIANMENSLSGKSHNEIIVDPIAVYVPL